MFGINSDFRAGFSTRASSANGYRPWGEVRRKQWLARVRQVVALGLLGLAILGVLSVAALFAASLALVGLVIAALIAIVSQLARVLARVEVRTEADRDGHAVIVARKRGNSWVPY